MTRPDPLERAQRDLATGRLPSADALRKAREAAQRKPPADTSWLRVGAPEIGHRAPTYSYVRHYKAKAARRRTTARVVEAIALAAVVTAAAALGLSAPLAVFWAALVVLAAAGLALVVLLRPRSTRVRRG
jgi:fatty acid desaturase